MEVTLPYNLFWNGGGKLFIKYTFKVSNWLMTSQFAWRWAYRIRELLCLHRVYAIFTSIKMRFHIFWFSFKYSKILLTPNITIQIPNDINVLPLIDLGIIFQTCTSEMLVKYNDQNPQFYKSWITPRWHDKVARIEIPIVPFTARNTTSNL